MSDMTNDTIMERAVSLADELYAIGKHGYVTRVAKAIELGDLEEVMGLVQIMLKQLRIHHGHRAVRKLA